MSIEIKLAHERTRQAFGPERLQAELADHGIHAGIDRIKRIRCELALRCLQKLKFKVTTDSRHLVMQALFQAVAARLPTRRVVHRSGYGSQYCAHTYQRLLRQFGMQVSMSRKGNCWDNAPMESCWCSMKNERGHLHRFATRGDAKREITEHIEIFYNRIRKQARPGYLSPAAFMQQHYEQQIAA